jgi:hypothetical protein
MNVKSYDETSEVKAQFVGRSLLRICGLLVLLYVAFSQLL